MIYAYLFALLPIIGGGLAWRLKRKMVPAEWLIAAAVGLLTAFLFNCIAVCSMTADWETLSGQMTRATYHPEWVEEYETPIIVTSTDSDGNLTSTIVGYDTNYRTHTECWDCEDTFGRTHDISRNQYLDMISNFGGSERWQAHKSGFYSGDPYLYIADNKEHYIYPTTKWRLFTNNVKAAPSEFSFPPIPSSASVFEYPKNLSPWASNRLLGTAANDFNLLEWDRMNSRLGPRKKVNVIAVGFRGSDSINDTMGKLQESKWIGGKKNDLVICYGDGWAYVFGWTEREDVKAGLKAMFLEGPIGASLIPKIEAEIERNYCIKDWTKFDYISVKPPLWSYWILALAMFLAQGAVWFWVVRGKDA